MHTVAVAQNSAALFPAKASRPFRGTAGAPPLPTQHRKNYTRPHPHTKEPNTMAQYHQYTIYRQYPYSTPPEGNPPKSAPLQNLAGAKKKTLRCAGRAQGLPAPRSASAALRPGSKCGLCSVRAGVFSGGNARASRRMADTSPRRSVFVPPWDARPVARYNSSCGWPEWEVGVDRADTPLDR